MKDNRKTKKELLNELELLRRQIDKLEETGRYYRQKTAALMESEELYRTLIETSPDPIVMYNLKGELIAANRQAAHTYGVTSVADFLREVKTVFDLLTEEGKTDGKASFQRTLTEGTSQRNEYQLILREGRIITAELHSSLIRTATGEPRAFMSIVRDITDRRQLEEKLRISEERYRTILEDIDEGYFENDLQGNLTFVNDAICKGLGYTREELIGMNYRKYNDETVLPNVSDVFDQIYKTGKPSKRYEAVYVTKDGKKHYSEASGSLMRNAKGEPIGFRGIVRNIDDRKRFEEELFESRRRLTDIIDFLPDATFVIDQEGKVIAWNHAIEQLTGIKAADMLGKSHYEYTLPFYGERRPMLIDLVLNPQKDIEAKYVNAKRKESNLDGEAYTHNLKGEKIYLFGRASALRDSKGNIVGAVESIRDITDRRKAEEALREREEFLSTIIENIPDMIFIKDAKALRFIRFNQAGEKLLGQKRENLIGKSDYDFFPKEQADFFIKKDREVLEKGRLFDIPEESIDTKTGPRILHTKKIPIPGKEGKPEYLLGISEDISERKRMEEEKAELQDQLFQSQKMESVGRLAGGVAHDFNNMLYVILGHVEMALRRSSRTQPIYSNLEEIRKAAQRSADLTGQLLAFARKQVIVPKILNLNETVEGMLQMLQRIIGETIHLKWRPATNLWLLKADPSQIGQILANLCLNARDAITTVGQLTIDTQNITVDAADCRKRKDCIAGDYVVLTVSDNGCGMSKEILDKLFEPFFTTKGLTQGTGLGLATIYGIVKQNDGFIDVESEVGRGTTFRIYLPRHSGKYELPEDEF